MGAYFVEERAKKRHSDRCLRAPVHRCGWCADAATGGFSIGARRARRRRRTDCPFPPPEESWQPKGAAPSSASSFVVRRAFRTRTNGLGVPLNVGASSDRFGGEQVGEFRQDLR